MGGDHKCPLCAATFTRPQHVGRHLRAHTGDRPYECKECPLRFARSDLLSRHVNKAHPKANGAADKGDKKPRRKSISVAQQSIAQQQQQQQPLQPSLSLRPPSPNRPAIPLLPRAAVVPPPPEPTAYQAQRMYPNHPLLRQNAGGWASGGYDLGSQQFVAPLGDSQLGGADNAGLGHVDMQQGVPFAQNPYASTAMRLSGSDQGDNGMTFAPAAFATSLPTNFNHQQQPLGFEPFVKKRACDQCNHSKVRCDFEEPCARCSHRAVACTYSKPQRARTSPSASGRSGSGHSSGVASNDRVSLVIGGFPERRNSAPQRVQTMDQGAFLTSDALLHSGMEPNWATNGTAHGQQPLHVMTDVNANSNSFLQQSPLNMSLALTPTLTHSTSPTASEGTDRCSSTNSNHYSMGWKASSTDYNVTMQN